MAPIEQIQQGVEAGNFFALAKAISAIENNAMFYKTATGTLTARPVLQLYQYYNVVH